MFFALLKRFISNLETKMTNLVVGYFVSAEMLIFVYIFEYMLNVGKGKRLHF